MVSGFPSKSLQGSLFAVVGMQASTLTDALEHGTEHPADIAILIVGLFFTGALMIILVLLLRKELRRIQSQENEIAERNLESASLGSSHHRKLKKAKHAEIGVDDADGVWDSDGMEEGLDLDADLVSGEDAASPEGKIIHKSHINFPKGRLRRHIDD
eukprot:CAMPEP_0184484650 /NCGR_PEP_ID=MMETSP0113_2-20130426/6343_1 /TAXON_ID=91329 /ORGANISM="Norrisiella sphaerica, Strain BC52" /LENGTH=156 /DNA_ID=CAMNT_0026865735 /DNA_START=546 /DNA_END=1016 /DNA_ORIENTATION=-